MQREEGVLQAEQPTLHTNGGTPGHLKQEAALNSLREVEEGQESCADQDCTLNACCAQADVPDGEVRREENQTCEQELLQEGDGGGNRKARRKHRRARPRSRAKAKEQREPNCSEHLTKDNGKSV